MKRFDPIPNEFSSYEEAGAFWDAHDTTDYSEIFETVESGGRPRPFPSFWNHPSVRKLASGRDPVQVITERAQELVFEAVESGWQGPPFDPFALAGLRKLKVVPQPEITDARSVPDGKGGAIIEFNPIRPKRRIRFSICHELAHSLFPDYADRVRNRVSHEQMDPEDWPVEMLCNIGAAELLMPIGSFQDVARGEISIDKMRELREKFEVSMEAILLRTVKLSDEPLAVFCTSVANEAAVNRRYALQYCVSSKSWAPKLRPGCLLPDGTALSKCTAVGYTSKGRETWNEAVGELDVEAMGVPAYPKHRFPRVVGLIRPRSRKEGGIPRITYLRRDATEPITENLTIVAHVVNDKTPNWGAGFGRFLARKWPHVQENFRRWATTECRLQLGETFLSEAAPSLLAFEMVSQRGYGQSKKPRIRYEELRKCLEQLAEVALAKHASVQMPKIGAGEAGGAWPIVEEMIEDTLCRRGVPVTVCELPDAKAEMQPQMDLSEQFNLRG
jgi:hypothetical protein